MDHDEAVARLPVVYRRVLAWIDQGQADDEIASRLGIEREAVAPLVQLAQAKLARLTEAPSSDEGP